MSRVPVEDPAMDLVIAFVNTHDLLNDPVDRLDEAVAQRVLARHLGDPPPVDEPLVARLKELRGRVYRVFAAPDAQSKVDALNELLRHSVTGARLSPDASSGGEGLRLELTGPADPIAQVAAQLSDTLVRAVATGGADRLGICAGDPCRCVYLDRTRARRQRYCCELCNDRMAAAASRRRRSAA